MHRLSAVLLGVGLLGVGGTCASNATLVEPASPAAASDAVSPPTAAAEPIAAAAATEPMPRSLVFSHNDIDEALKRAANQGKLVFVDAWAEWCHTCLSMESYVLNDPSLTAFAEQYEFVALDTEKPENAEFLERFSIETWPTFYVIRPGDLDLIGMWPGAASVKEMHDFLASSLDAASMLQNAQAEPHIRHFHAARRAQSEGKHDIAVREYAEAYRGAPVDWPRKNELLVGYLDTLLKTKQFETCVKIGKLHLDEVHGAAYPARFAQRYFTCLGQSRSLAREPEIARAVEKLRGLSYSPTPDMSFDDQADVLTMLSMAYSQLGRKDEAARALAERLNIAEAAAAKAETPEQARTFDRIRVFAYVDSGQGERAVQLLEQREKELPHAYSPPSLLAEILIKLGRGREALAAFDRAVANAEGPRRAAFLEKKLDYLTQQNDVAGQRLVLDQLIELRQTLRGAQNQERLSWAKARREAMAATPPGR